MYSEGVEDQNYLRGVQIADANGVVSYTSIFPACYSGRWPHIHFEVYPDEASITDAANAIATSQVALPKDVCDTVYAEPGYEASVSNLAQVTLESDNVFGDDGGARQLATVTGDVASGYAVALAVGVDTTTTPTAGAAPAGGGGNGNGWRQWWRRRHTAQRHGHPTQRRHGRPTQRPTGWPPSGPAPHPPADTGQLTPPC